MTAVQAVFLMLDVEGSTALWEREPAAMSEALGTLDRCVLDAVEQTGGQLIKPRGEGDSHFTLFPTVHAAASAATQLHRTLAAVDWPTPTPLVVRAAIHLGEAEFRDNDYYGATVNRCARLRAAAWGGQTLMTSAAADVLRDHVPDGTSLVDRGSHRLRDLHAPVHVWELVDLEHPREFPPIGSLSRARHNLPQETTSFLGRDDDVEQIREALETARLVSICGTAGLGKTRLSLRVGAELVDVYANGVWFIDLSDVVDGELVPVAVASTIGLRVPPGSRSLDVVLDVLPGRDTLLVLDNCEHLAADCASLAAALLRAGSGLKLLATSREPLRVPGETVIRPAPLTTSAAGGPRYSPAVQLFAERAREVRGSFDLDENSAPLVARVCEQLDGLPLAIELAAARMSHLSVQQIEARLGDRLRLLAADHAVPGRHRTLEAALDWSHSLLTEPERVLLRRLSVFRGDFSLGAAEAVCSGPDLPTGEILDGLASLVDRSLVDVDFTTDEARYRLLQTVQRFAGDRLAESGEIDDRRRALLSWCAGVAAATPETVEPLAAELDHFRAALDHTLNGLEPVTGLQLAADLFELWYQRLPTEGITRLERMLAAHPITDRARVAALNALGGLLLEHDLARARDLHEQARSLANELDDRAGEVRARVGLGGVAVFSGDVDEAIPLLEAAIDDARRAGRSELSAEGLMLLARAMTERDLPRANALVLEALDVGQGIGSVTRSADVVRQMCSVLIQRGHFAQARDLLSDAMARSLEVGDERSYGACLVNYGRALMALGEHEAARDALSGALEIADRLGNRLMAAFGHALSGELARLTGDLERASRHYVASNVEFDGLGVTITPHYIRLNLAHVAFAEGDLDHAWTTAFQTMRAALDEALPHLVVEAVELVGELAAAEGRWRDAVQALAAADAKRGELELEREPADRIDFDAARDACRAALGAAFEPIWKDASKADPETVAAALLSSATVELDVTDDALGSSSTGVAGTSAG